MLQLRNGLRWEFYVTSGYFTIGLYVYLNGHGGGEGGQRLITQGFHCDLVLRM